MNMTREEMIEDGLKVSRAGALKLLKLHGWGPTTPTAIEADGAVANGTDFDSEMGVHDTYLAQDIFDWLGY
jgi:hypothetical protein